MVEALSQGMGAGQALQLTLAGDVEPIAGYFIYSVVLSLTAYVGVGFLEQMVRRRAA